MGEWSERLAGMDNEWKQAPRAADLGELPPPGEYQAFVQGFDFFESKIGEVYFKTELEVATGPEKGWPIEVIHSLADPDRYGFLKQHLHKMGLDPEFPLSELEERVTALLDVPVSIEVYEYESKKHGDTRSAAKVIARLGDPMRQDQSELPADTADMAGEKVAAGKSDDDIPF